jgi:hypothetical protein
MHQTMIHLFLSCKLLLCSVELSFLVQSSVYSVYYINVNIDTNIFLNSCFPHIVNLACKAMLATWSRIEFERDPIRKLRGVIQSVSILFYFNSIFLNFYIDSCILFATFQFFQPFGRFGITATSIDS